MPVPIKTKAPERIEIDGKPHIMVRKAAEEAGITYQGLLHRIERGQLLGAVKHCPGPGQGQCWYMPVDADIMAKYEKAPKDAEQTFPALHRNADGVPTPQKLKADLPEVPCADCPHCDNKDKRCYGLTRDSKMHPDGTLIYSLWWCHRIGRKVKPLPEWIEGISSKPCVTPQVKAAKDLPLPTAKVEDARFKEEAPKRDYIRIVLLDLENEAASLDEEAAEIEARFESIVDRSTKVKQAIVALKALEEVKASE